jgi:signal transduction histidine kinase
MSSPRREPPPLPAYPLAGHGTPRPPRPPLTKRMRPWHWMAIDWVVAAVIVLSGTFLQATSAGPGTGSVAPPVKLLIAVWIFLPVALRRRAPVTAFGALIILAVALTGSSSIGSGLIYLVFTAAAIVLFTVTVTSSRQTGAAALVLALTVLVLIVAFDHDARGHGVPLQVGLALVIAWMLGYSMRQRRLYALTLQHQATSRAVAEERLRIARELHDVVAHSMSVIAVQAGYGQYVIDSSPDDARDALGAIQATSRDALEEMRRMLGVLRQQDAASGAALAAASGAPDAGTAPGAPGAPGAPAAPAAPGVEGALAGPADPVTSAPLSPAPGLASLGRLIERTQGAGVKVSLECSGQIRAAPAGVDLSAYRIVQEALTNVVKHAGGGASCVISLDYGTDALDIRVADDGSGSMVLSPASSPGSPAHGRLATGGGAPVAGAGHGIIGMRERAHLCGGDFSAGALPDGGFEVTATLPLPPAGDGGAP